MPIRRISARAAGALADFFRLEAAGGIVLIAAAALAMLLANSPLSALYDRVLELPVQVRVGELDLHKPLLLWINDGLMAVFFLLVALELKREALSGQLSSRAQLLLPLACAAGGVAVPAAIYALFNRGDVAAMAGWAIPAATDIAFALGVLTLLGPRVPLGLKLLLSTIAVVDDLAAILIIAAFYTGQLSLLALVLAGIALAAMVVLNRIGVVRLAPYLLLGTVVWVCVLKSGVHATLAGVATGLLIPNSVRGRRDDDDGAGQSPLQALEHMLHPWVAFAILPLFAFANAGLDLSGFALGDTLRPVPLGIALGLLLGKTVGVLAAAGLMRITGLARLPDGVDARALVGLALLCGIGFTMSLFIASLAFADEALADTARLGILLGSLASAMIGGLWLHLALPKRVGIG